MSYFFHFFQSAFRLISWATPPLSLQLIIVTISDTLASLSYSFYLNLYFLHPWSNPSPLSLSSTSFYFPLSFIALIIIHLHQHCPNDPLSSPVLSFQAAEGFYSLCNPFLVLSLFVTQWESIPASAAVLSPHSPPLNVICSAAQVCSIITLFL